jgi:hypothetical protein
MIPSLLFGFNIFMLDGTKPTGSLWVACEKYYYIKHNNRLTGLASRYRKVLPPIYLQIQPLKSGYLLINGFYKDFAEKDSLYFKDQNELNCFYWGVYSIPADKEIIPTKYYDIKFFTTNDGNFFHLYKNRYLDDSAGYDYEGVCYQDSYSDTIRYIIPISDKIHSIRYDKVNNEFTGLDTRDKKYQYNLEGDRLLLKQDTANVQHLE